MEPVGSPSSLLTCTAYARWWRVSTPLMWLSVPRERAAIDKTFVSCFENTALPVHERCVVRTALYMSKLHSRPFFCMRPGQIKCYDYLLHRTRPLLESHSLHQLVGQVNVKTRPRVLTADLEIRSELRAHTSVVQITFVANSFTARCTCHLFATQRLGA